MPIHAGLQNRYEATVYVRVYIKWRVSLANISLSRPEAGVLVRKLRQLIPLGSVKRANPRCFIRFILLCGISCELAGCVHRPIVDSESTIVG
jgi:hypothetical protein